MKQQPHHNEQSKQLRRASYLKIAALIGFAAAVLTFVSLGWFANQQNVLGNGMGVKVQGAPYTIQTRNGSGYYKDQWEKLHSNAIEWQVSAENNFDNHSEDLDFDETEPGLEPGDHGSLEFRVSPLNSDTLTVDCLFEINAYAAEETEDEHGVKTTTLTEINNSALNRYLNAHIMLFAGIDENGKYTDLIDNDNEALERVLEDQVYRKDESTYTTIYWYWPEHLSDLTESAHTIYAPSEHEDVIAYIARNKDGFFKDCSDSNAKVLTDLTNLYNSYSNSTYNHYNLRYDNADLDIGNNLSYVILSMQVK